MMIKKYYTEIETILTEKGLPSIVVSHIIDKIIKGEDEEKNTFYVTGHFLRELRKYGDKYKVDLVNTIQQFQLDKGFNIEMKKET